MLLLELLDFLVRHLYIRIIIHFISEDHDFDVTARVFLDLVQPDWDAKKTFTVRQIEDNDYAIGALVVCISDRPVPLLSSCIPYLSTYQHVLDRHIMCSKLNANSRVCLSLELILCISEE